MSMDYGLFQQQILKLNMSQELVQAISLLQYTSMELANFVEQIAMENPLIEVEIHYDSTFANYSLKRKKQTGDTVSFEAFIPDQTFTLSNYLKEQLWTKTLSPNEKKYLTFLIDHVNNSGYLEISLEEASQLLQIPVEIGEKALTVLQSLDPAGIGARNLQESIILQLKRKPDIEPEDLKIIESYFHPFVQRKWKKIEKELNIPIVRIQQLFDLVQTLEPRPGGSLSNERTEYVVPDIMIEKKPDVWHIKITDESCFQMNINERYYHELMQKREPMITLYAKEKYQQFQWLKQSIAQRKQTMLNLMKAIIEIQEPFLLGQVQELMPMTMFEIAEKIGVHESTVSRAVKNKYVYTPIGMLSLRGMFTGAVKTSGGHHLLSTDYVKKQIRQFIHTENKRKPYSDQDLVQLLAKQGIDISRRTVAKYREQLNIASSMKRKRYSE